jgi:MbtH protein
MAWDEEEDTTTYRVLISEESKAYSILSDKEKPPVGWKDAGFQGRKEECLKYVQRVWTDVRSLSLDELEARIRLP